MSQKLRDELKKLRIENKQLKETVAFQAKTINDTIDLIKGFREKDKQDAK